LFIKINKSFIYAFNPLISNPRKNFFSGQKLFFINFYTQIKMLIIKKKFFIGWLTSNKMLRVRNDGIYKTDYIIQYRSKESDTPPKKWFSVHKFI